MSANTPTALGTDTMPAWTQHRYGEADAVRRETVDRPRARTRRGAAAPARHGPQQRRHPRHARRAAPRASRVRSAPAAPADAGDGCRGHRGRDRRRRDRRLASATRWSASCPPVGGSPRTPSRPPPGSCRARPRSTPTSPPRCRWRAEPRGRRSNAGSAASGHRVLVIGASGGVGTFAVQLAALRGAEVWALCGERSRVARRGTRRGAHVRLPPGAARCAGTRGRHRSTWSSTSPAPRRCARCSASCATAAGSCSCRARAAACWARSAGSCAPRCCSIGSRRPLRPLAATAKPEVLVRARRARRGRVARAR